jgi:hypothetical protein
VIHTLIASRVAHRDRIPGVAPVLARSHAAAAAMGYAPASACRPRSAIVSQVTLIGRPPACTVPGVVVASPSSTKRSKIPTVKPCASMIASVHPSGEPASIRSARFCSALRQPFPGLTTIARWIRFFRALAVHASSAARRRR